MSSENNTSPIEYNSTQQTKNKEKVCIGLDFGIKIPQCNCLWHFYNDQPKEKQIYIEEIDNEEN